MKNTLFIVVLLFFIITHACGVAQSKNNMPLLIQTSANSKLGRLEIVTSCVKDTTKIAVTVSVRFDENFSDSVELNTPKEIYVLGISYLEENTAKKNVQASHAEIIFEDFQYVESDFSFLDEIKSNQKKPQDTCIRKACEAQFRVWLKKQPYSNMYDIRRFYGHKGFALTYPVYLIPERYCQD